MSKERAKGRIGENRVRDFLRPLFPGVERTGSNLATPWGACDLRETGPYGIEVKRWKDVWASIKKGWPQAERNAERMGLTPVLVALRHRRGIDDALVVMRLEDWRAIHEVYLRATEGGSS